MASENRRLRRIRWGVRVAPLNNPYELSFAQLTAFDVVWVWAEDEDGRIGIGEAVPLPGYNWETTDTVRATVARLCENTDGIAASELVQRCREVRFDHPFAAAAVMTALDMPFFLEHTKTGLRFPISAPVSGACPVASLRESVDAHLAKGYEFIKVKVGRDFDSEAAAARAILTEWPSRHFRVVFDSNQAHTERDGFAFARMLRDCESDRLQWFEQPVDRRDWKGMERLCRARDVPIVLDECIYDAADVERAAAIGAFGIKLKLVKNFGISETLSLARLAGTLGLVVVFGNGVASDLGNLAEYLTLAAGDGIFASPSESSGFAKLRQPILGSVLAIDAHGQFGCTAPAGTLAERIKEFTAAQFVAG